MSLLSLALARLRSRPGLSAALLAALTLAVAVPAAIPMYVDASTARLLDAGVTNSSQNRPTFSYLFAARSDDASWADYVEVDGYIVDDATNDLGLPVRHASRLVETNRFPTSVATPTDDEADRTDLGSRPIAALSDAADVMSITDGRRPGSARVGDDGSMTLEVVVQAEEAAGLELAVGDRLVSADPSAAPDDPARTIELVVVGLWEADETDDRWIVEPDLLADRLFTSDDALLGALDRARPGSITSVRWYAVLDGSGLGSDDVDGLIDRAAAVRREADVIRPGTVLESDPIDSLLAFRARSGLLSRRLLAYGLPLLAMIGAFVSLIVSVALADRRTEITTLRNRGASPRQIVAASGMEAALMAAGSFVVGLFAARALAATMGRTRSFLDFSNETGISIGLSRAAVLVALLVALLGIAAQLIPTWVQARASIGDRQTSRAHAARPPWWQRSSLDVMVVIAVAVIAFTINRSQRTRTTEPLDDPTVMALPAVLALGVGLVVLRVVGPLLHLLARGAASTDGVSALLALRRLARSPGTRSIPLLLVIMTVALGTFTASMARTLDLQLFDEAQHRVGADRAITETGAAIVTPSVVDGGFGSTASLQPEPVPVGSFDRVWGIDRATRVGQYSGAIEAGLGQRAAIAFFAVQPQRFSDVAFWRDDFATEPLPELIARLDAQPEAVLVSRDIADRLDLQLGDTAAVEVTFGRRLLPSTVVVVGFFDQFPTWDPSVDEPAIVMNLDHVFALSGQERLFDVWLRADGQAVDPLQQASDLASLGVRSLADTTPSEEVEAAFDQPDRQGVFGLLSIGFIAATVISAAALCLYALSGVRAGLAEFGVLRALGLSGRRLGGSMAIELGLLVAIGVTAGLATGLGLSRWLVPVLLDTTPEPPAPTFLAVTDWAAVGSIALALAIIFAALVIALVSVVRRLRLFEAIKLGEAQ